MIRLVPFGLEHVGRATAWESDPRIYTNVFGFEPTGLAARMQRRLSPPEHERHSAIVNSHGIHVGCASLLVEAGYVTFFLYTGPEHQRHGYGTHAVSTLRALGETLAPGLPCVIRVFADEPGQREWYERQGFTKIGREHPRYLDQPRPLLVMSTAPGK